MNEVIIVVKFTYNIRTYSKYRKTHFFSDSFFSRNGSEVQLKQPAIWIFQATVCLEQIALDRGGFDRKVSSNNHHRSNL